MTMPKKIQIEFGAFADPIHTQLKRQGWMVGPMFNARTIQADADAIFRLKVRGYLSDPAIRSAHRKLLAFILRLAVRRTTAREKLGVK